MNAVPETFGAVITALQERIVILVARINAGEAADTLMLEAEDILTAVHDADDVLHRAGELVEELMGVSHELAGLLGSRIIHARGPEVLQ